MRRNFRKQRLTDIGAIACIFAVVATVIVLLATSLTRSSSSSDFGRYGSLAECLADNRPPNLSAKQSATARPPKTVLVPPPVLFTHASIWTGDAPLLLDADLLIANGKVVAVSAASGQRLTPPADPTLVTYDATGRFITPGLIDLHSHAGLGAWPGDLWATDDVNEMTEPTFPQLRAVDALDPLDPAFPRILAGGVTVSQVMPGSGDAMGGEGVLVKNRGETVQDMLLPGAPRLMKMACGENPKRVFGRKGVTPMSRLGSAWVMRERLELALQLRNDQDHWCRQSAAFQADNPFPNQRKHESLAALLRGEVTLNTHCYLVQDFEMMLRLASEFSFKIRTFHHALSAWRLGDVLAFSNISVATFSDLGLYKHEAYDASTTAPKLLAEQGVNLILKSDHPVTPSGWIAWEAAKAHHYGLPAQKAIAAITSAPAIAAGIADHLGFLKAGYDADVVVFDRDPLVLGARAYTVFVDGARLVDLKDPISPHPTSDVVHPDVTAEGPTQVCGFYNASATVLSGEYKTVSLSCYSVVGVTIFTPTAINGAATMTVRDGVITCLGLDAECPLPAEPSCAVFRLPVGTLMPGMLEAGTHVGQYDIESEDVTGDGRLGGAGTAGEAGVISTLDGLRFKSRHVRAAWASGITTVVARPTAPLLISGQSSAFRTCCGESMAGLAGSPVIVADRTALHVVVGNAAKNGGTSASISGQISALRSMFDGAQAALASNTSVKRADPLSPFLLVLQRQLPLLVEVHHADEILSVVRLQREFGFNLTIVGGAESGLVAGELAATTPKTGVLLFSRVTPATFETMRVAPDTLRTLAAAGVPFALSTGDTDNARNLRWEAGWNQEAAGLTDQQTVEAVTSSVARMFRLPAGTAELAVGRRAEFVLFNGSPFSLQTTVQLVAVGTHVDCRPKQR